MPLRPDFKILVDDVEVLPSIAKDAVVDWDIAEEKVLQSLSAAWADAANSGHVSGDYAATPSTEAGGSAVQFPALGTVSARVRLFRESLMGRRSVEGQRSHGFFVMVRGRLLNPDDELLFLPDPSFGTFYRCQFVIEADGLDQDLLADRERLHRGTPRTEELAVLQHALYLAARNELTNLDQKAAADRRSESLLPVTSWEHFRAPLNALLLRHGQVPSPPVHLSRARIERVSLGTDEPLSALTENAELQVNSSHPFFNVVHAKLGTGRVARDAMQVFDLFSVSERLLEGYLWDLGVTEESIVKILSWRDGLFRSMAERFSAVSLDDVERDVLEASHVGGKHFEDAISHLFGAMGFESSRDGVSGRKDVLVIAPIGDDSYKFTVEAKGSNTSVKNDDAEISGAAAHRDQVQGAKHALVVAREFAGFARNQGEMPAILAECESVGGVSIATVETLVALYQAILTYGYPLDLVFPVLTTIESPQEKLLRIGSLTNPTEGFDYHGVLNEIWRRQQNQAFADLVPYRAVWQEGENRWNCSSVRSLSGA
jgi:hypothetical protein